VCIGAAGAERAAASALTPFGPTAGGIEMEVADLEGALAAVIAGLGPMRERIAAIGIAGLAESGAPLTAGPTPNTDLGSPHSAHEPPLNATGPIIAWHDGRGEETVAALDAKFGPELARWTGRRVRTVSSLAKLGWLIAHGLPVPDRWLGVPELVLFLLTGIEATEHSLAARTGAYHVTERRFLPDVIAHVLNSSQPIRASDATAVGARRAGEEAAVDLFPPVRAAGTAMGILSQEAATRYGLPVGIPVTIAGHDHLAAAAGLGGRPDDLFNSVGTAETLVRRLETAPDVDRALELDLAVTVWPGGDAWGLLASATRSGLVIDALAAHLGLDPSALDGLVTASEDGVTARHHPAPAPGLSVPEAAGDNGVPGRSTGNIVELGQGIEVPAGPPPAMWAATLRALARRTAAAAERVSALAGPHGRLVVFGGGSASPLWLRAKADELAVPVMCSPVAEATARGAALAAGAAAGWWSQPSAGPTPPGSVVTGRRYTPSPDHRSTMAGVMTGRTTPERPIEPEMSPEVAERTSGLRTGWTTGTCASAAAKAAAVGLCTGTRPETVEVGLPGGQRVSFRVEAGPSGEPWEAVVIKDAGDDPDCTDGARMTAAVAFADVSDGPAGPDRPDGHELRAGDGIGTVTLPGLGLPVGGPAINPVPRRMINAALAEVTDRGLVVTFSVPGGRDMAGKTTNERLGIVGGISILGTTGIVKPFSTASYRASVVQQIDVAAAQGHDLAVLATGSRSEAYALAAWPDVPPVCVVEVGDFTGIALRHAAGAGMRRAVFVGMVGKITKLAAGIMMTHFHRSKVDTDLLAEVARAAGAPPGIVAAATETATARHFYEVCLAEGIVEPLEELCRRAAANCRAHVDGNLDVSVHLVDFHGEREIAHS
jgi:cobalt-precorrin-5B (C1)-methyltransferase